MEKKYRIVTDSREFCEVAMLAFECFAASWGISEEKDRDGVTALDRAMEDFKSELALGLKHRFGVTVE